MSYNNEISKCPPFGSLLVFLFSWLEFKLVIDRADRRKFLVLTLAKSLVAY